jgi:hypothetical protein
MQTPNPTATMTSNSPYAGHTPGPWKHTPGQDTIWANDGDLLIARTDYTRGAMAVNEDEANARLIAAAPMLLQEVESLQATNAALRAALVWQTQVLEDYWYSKNTEEKNFAAEGIQSAIDHARAALAGSVRSKGVQS